jgi:hypothetical protein
MKPIEFEFSVEPGLLFTRVTGEVFDVAGATAYTDRMLDECVRCGRRRLLVDERETRHHEPMYAAWRVAEHLVDRGITAQLERVACVPHDYSWILARLFTMMLRQRGVSIRLFKSMDEARTWVEAP